MNTEAKKYLTETKKFFLDKRVQLIIFLILALGILIFASWIRLQTLPNLIDSTTGDYTPLDLDSYYFLRHSETLLENNWKYPEIDPMRYPSLNPGYSQETMPHAVVLIYKTLSLFDDSKTLMYANVISPLIFFLIGLLIFFFLVYIVTENKWLALFSSFLVSIIPSYLYRTLVGASDHDSFGMLGFFSALLIFYYLFNEIQNKKISNIKSVLYGLISGFFIMFSISSWGGSGTYIFMILPLVFLINWLLNKKSNNLSNALFYLFLISGTLLFSLLFNYSPLGIMRGYMMGTSGILTFFTLIFIFLELFIINCKKVDSKIKKNSEIFSLIFSLILGLIFYQIFVGHVFEMILRLLNTIITPFGTGRVGLTVAENKQPYLTDLISQLGKTLFYSFILGILIIGFKISKEISSKKLKYLFYSSYVFFILSLLFTRISPSSILNGENFISKAIFFLSFLILFLSSVYIYKKTKWEVSLKYIFLAVLGIVLILSVRSAIRVFFVIVPFICMIAIFGLYEIYNYSKKSKDELLKLLAIVLLIFLIINLIFASNNFIKSSEMQAKYQTPPYNSDWQKAMSWVRDNTPENSIFLHWWDYGYWVQTGGNRVTITDGGHFNSYWDHLIARYVLTTPYPETAKSFMKTHEVNYLLIDPTDIGKYSAYSSIGDDKEISDRSSFIPTFISDPKTTQETANKTIRYYQGGTYVDKDFSYELNGKTLFFPQNNAILAGLIISKNSQGFFQPEAVYVLNGEQYKIPIRYLYYNGELLDFKTGLNSIAYLYANVYSSSTGQSFDIDGAVMYLSEKTKDSLVVQLYLMNDPNELYPELTLVHSQSNYPFNFYYGGFNGPIKIWEFTPTDKILIREEFLFTDGEFGELDNLNFSI